MLIPLSSPHFLVVETGHICMLGQPFRGKVSKKSLVGQACRLNLGRINCCHITQVDPGLIPGIGISDF